MTNIKEFDIYWQYEAGLLVNLGKKIYVLF